MFQGDTAFFGTSNFTFNGFDKNVERCSLSIGSSQTENIEYFQRIKTNVFTRNVNYSDF